MGLSVIGGMADISVLSRSWRIVVAGYPRVIKMGLTPWHRDDVSYGFLVMLLFWSMLACQSTRWIQYFILVPLP